ncbi:MAG: hypothetical protein WC708_05790 [Lentisphaeria bacterium]
MKIFLLSYHFFNRTAEGLVTTKLARALADRGHQLTVFTAGIESELTSSEVKRAVLDGIDVEIVLWPVAQQPTVWNWLNQRGGWLGKRLAAIPGTIYGYTLQDRAWARAVEAAVAARVAQDGLPDVLHSRLNHYASHVAASRVKQHFPRLRWCAYFSDPWPYHLYPAPYFFRVGPVSRIRQEWVLNHWLTQAETVVYPGVRLMKHLLNGSRTRFRAKARAIPHIGRIPALDPMTVTRNKEKPIKRDAGKLLLRHAGLLMKERRVEPLYDGLRQLFQAYPAAQNGVVIEFCGRCTVLADGTMDPRLAPPEDLRPNIAISGYQSPESVITWLDEADVYLLVEGQGLNDGIFLPSKLADYVTGCRPILALSPENGEVADCLRAGGGLRADTDDPAAIARALHQLWDYKQSGRLGELLPPPATVAAFAPATIAAQYESVFAPQEM